MKNNINANNYSENLDENLPLISIIAPALNLEDYIEKCLKSVINQTYKNFEFLIVDNGSTDKTVEIINKYASVDSRIKLLICPEKGVSKARNLALKDITGEYVCFVDGDDAIDPNYCKDLYENLISYNSDMSICSYKRQKKIKPFHHKKTYKVTFMDNFEAIKRTICDRGFNGVVYAKLFKRSLLEGIFFDESIHFSEDLLFVVEYLYKCKNVSYFPKKLYHYFVRSNGAVMGSFNEKKLTCITSLEKIIEISSDKEIIECAKAWKSMLCVMLIYFYHRDKVKDEKVREYLHNTFVENKKYVKKSRYVRKLYKNNIDFIGFVIKHW